MSKKLTLAILGSTMLSAAAFAPVAMAADNSTMKDRPAATSTTTSTTPSATTPSTAPSNTMSTHKDTTAAATAPTTAKASGTVYAMHAGEWRSTKLIGLDVYNGKDKVGDIKELIVGKDGQVEAVVVGAGGFLGMGEHDVAIPYKQVQFVDEPAKTAAGTDNMRMASNTASNAPVTTRTDAGGGRVTPDNNAAARTAYRGYPDHATIDMTKDQLKALPEVRYAR